MAERLFVLPFPDHHLVYAPLRGLVLLVPERLPLAPRVRAALADWPPVTAPAPRSGALAPDFLGLVPTRVCNLDCGYCDFRGEAASGVMPAELACAGVALMAELARGRPDGILAIHFFGGEPLLAWDLLGLVVERARAEARRHGLRAYFELSTNGVCDPGQAEWLGATMHRVVLSLDGGPREQDRQRPRPGGGASSATVERTAAILGESTAELCLRLCVTAEGLPRLGANVRRFVARYRPSAIAIEPLVVASGREPGPFGVPDPWSLARVHAEAARYCRSHGVDLLLSGTDLDQRDSSLCPVARDGLILHPDGRLSACYLPAQRWRSRGLELAFGTLVADSGFRLDQHRLTAIRALGVDRYPRCRDCFCRWHCAGGCHVAQGHPGNREPRDARCRLIRAVTYWKLLDRLGADQVAADFLAGPEPSLSERILVLDAGCAA